MKAKFTAYIIAQVGLVVRFVHKKITVCLCLMSSKTGDYRCITGERII